MATPQRSAAPGAPAAKPKRIKVRATRTGYYDHKRFRQGDVFILHDETLFSDSWMERVPVGTPERVTTGQQELQRQKDMAIAERAQAGDVDDVEL